MAGIGVLAYRFGPETARGFLHEFSGFVLFAVALVLIVRIDKRSEPYSVDAAMLAGWKIVAGAPDDPWVVAGKDPMLAPSQKIWGYESNWGSFAQYTKVQDHQCVPKPARLTWEEAAAYMLVGATAYRMLYGWSPNALREGDPVLIWGGAGGLGSMAIQIARAAGARPVAVVGGKPGSPELQAKIDYCKKRGATVVIRGLRALADFEYEFQQAHMNRHLAAQVETLFLMTSEESFYVSSSLVKEVALMGGDVSRMVPPAVVAALAKKRQQGVAP